MNLEAKGEKEQSRTLRCRNREKEKTRRTQRSRQQPFYSVSFVWCLFMLVLPFLLIALMSFVLPLVADVLYRP
jgi:hypothetical protein